MGKRAEVLREGVHRAYSAAAEEPAGEHPFPVGAGFAERLGYPALDLANLPWVATEAFSGVSNLSFAEISAGSRVLDLGCGSGVDSLIAAQKASVEGQVIGVDFSASMLARARTAAATSGATNLQFCQAAGERLPVDDESIDVALVNGIFNLNPGRERIFAELGRVMRRGGVVYAAELILKEELSTEVRDDEQSWFA